VTRKLRTAFIHMVMIKFTLKTNGKEGTKENLEAIGFQTNNK